MSIRAGMVAALLWVTLPVQAATSGQLRSTTDYYPYHLGPPTEDVAPYLSLEVAHKHKVSRWLRLQLKGTLISNPNEKYSPEKLFADLPEGFLEAKSSEFKFRFGMDTVNWGVVDLSSPSDTVNPSVLFHPMRVLKRGTPMAEILWDREVFGIHTLYIPRQAEPVLPAVDSRWLPRRFLMNITEFQTRLRLPDTMEYRYEPRQVIGRALDSNYGVKLFSHLGSWDLQITHFEGSAPSPKARPIDLVIVTSPSDLDADLESPVRIAPVIYRVRTSGAGVTWAGEKWIFRVESAYQHTISRDPLLQPWTWSSAVGAETNVNLGKGTMTWLAQFHHTQTPRGADNLITSSYRIFDRTAILGSRWAVRDGVVVTASALWNITDRGLFWTAGFEQKLSDAVKWGLSWRDFSAARDGLLKTYERNDHANMDIIYYF